MKTTKQKIANNRDNNHISFNNYETPPLSNRHKDTKPFAQRWVMVGDQRYYSRQFYDGSKSLTRYDSIAKMWVHLHFQPDEICSVQSG